MTTAFDVHAVRSEFPVLAQLVNGHPLAYLDSGATSQKPRSVLEAQFGYLNSANSAVHRGAHTLAAEATNRFEDARETVATAIGARAEEVVWTAGATAGLNILANSFGLASLGRGGEAARRFALQPGDRIVLTEAEHHANLIPWQELAARTGAELVHVRVDDSGVLDLDHARTLIHGRTRIVAFSHVSNVLGIVNPVRDITAMAHEQGAFVVLDACQSAPHIELTLGDLGVDFAVFSSHKLYGPDGIGVLFGKTELLNALPASNFGGSMISHVTLTEASYLEAPQRFEAGTQPISAAIATAAAFDWMKSIGHAAISAHEATLEAHLRERLEGIPGLRLLGNAAGVARVPLLSFEVLGVHAHDVGQFLDAYGIAVRVGHHCAAPLHARFGMTASVRASAAAYTTVEEIDRLADALAHVRGFFGVES
ncbi:MAG TPA: SufS family cysteine desulfurase [Microbacteriaceae bacterium]|nr:SufS family cysteine desulfurase [Microbacteriaceae bacterium]